MRPSKPLRHTLNEVAAMPSIKLWFSSLLILGATTAPVMCQDKPSTQTLSLSLTRRHLADYSAVLQLPNGRVDTDATVKRLKELEAENAKLKRMYADLALENFVDGQELTKARSVMDFSRPDYQVQNDPHD